MLLYAGSGLLNWDSLLPFALFGAFALVAFLVMEYMTAKNNRATNRLDEFKDPKLRRKREGKKDAISMVLERTSAMATPLQPKSELETSQLKIAIEHRRLSPRKRHADLSRLEIRRHDRRAISRGGPMLIFNGADQKTLTTTVLVSGLLFYLPDIVVWFIGKSRKEQIFLTLPDALDLLVVCVEAVLVSTKACGK